MIIRVMVKPHSPNPRIEDFGGNNLLVYLLADPEKNEANIELIQMLAKHYGVPWKNIKIKSGMTSKNKLIEVL
jgi:uncharacterized protein YggU (UPF0235/DUF167 family)